MNQDQGSSSTEHTWIPDQVRDEKPKTTMQTLKIKRLHPTIRLPRYAHPTDAGMDLYLPETLTLQPNERQKVPLGIVIELPPATVGLVREKGSRGAQGLKLFGGVIDEGYRGELIAIIWNTNKTPLEYKAGTPIAQLLVQPILHPAVSEAESLTDTSRGSGSFGSTYKVVDGAWVSTVDQSIVSK